MNIRHLNFIFIIFSLLALSCQSEKKEKASDPLWEIEEQVFENGKDVAIEEINEAIEKAATMRLSWAYSPVTIAIRVAGQQMIGPEVKILAKSKSGNELITHVVVMIEKKNIQDDSVADRYYRVELKLGGSIWQVMDVKEAWRCRAKRGHSDISAVLCK